MNKADKVAVRLTIREVITDMIENKTEGKTIHSENNNERMAWLMEQEIQTLKTLERRLQDRFR